MSSRFESIGLTKKQYEAHGARRIAGALQRRERRSSTRLSHGAAAAAAQARRRGARRRRQDARRRRPTILEIFMPFVAEADWVFSCANTARGLRPHAARGARALLLGAGEDRLARVDVGGAPARPREVGLPAHRGADAAGAQAAPRLRDAPRRARRDGRAPRPRRRAPAPRARGPHPHDVPRAGATPRSRTAARLAAVGVRPGDRVVLSGAEPPGVAHRLLRHPARGRRRRPRRPRPRGPAARERRCASSGARVALWDAGVEEQGRRLRRARRSRTSAPSISSSFADGGRRPSRTALASPAFTAEGHATSRASSTRAARPATRRA